MKISYKWLKEYVNIDLTPEQLAEKLTSAGVVVEHVTPAFEVIEGVVVGEIKEIEKHPDADKLSITKIDNGQEILQVVCGATNIRAGQKVPLAQIGTVLPGDFKIKKSKIRGIESFGMLCSSDELGLNLTLDDGIMILPKDTPIGLEVSEVLDLNDQILVLDLTPNRSDCLSILGIAKEVAALTGKEVKYPSISKVPENTSGFSIEIETNDCKNYIGGFIEGIEIQNSPIWLQLRLLKAGLRPINCVVDITNYVMLEYGQPLHAFDKKKIGTDKIVVKNIQKDTELMTLDGQTRLVPTKTLAITDGEELLAVAGVMGGASSEVDYSTEEVILESAYFNSVAVRKSVRGLNLRSEASSRFEKSVAPLYIKDAALRAIKMFEEICQCKASGIIEVGCFDYQPIKINLKPHKVSSLLGIDLSIVEIEKILRDLGCQITNQSNELIVSPPHHRVDLLLEVDLIEEIARVYGYDNIPVSLPTGKTTVGQLPIKEIIFRRIKNLLTSMGINELITYPFISPDSFTKTELDPNQAIELANPLGKENSLMRTSLLPSALESVVYNINHQREDIQFFEMGKVYLGQQPLVELPHEKEMLVVAQLRDTGSAHWLTGKGRKNDFYSIKGVLENILSLCSISNWKLEQESNTKYHPGRSGAIYVGTEKAGFIGQIHPVIAKKWEIREEFYILELDLEVIISQARGNYNYKSVVKYPSVKRDIALLVDKDIEAGKLTKVIKDSSPLIIDAEIFDVYVGKGIDENKKSIAISITMQKNGTLKEGEINFFIKNALKILEEKFAAKLRD